MAQVLAAVGARLHIASLKILMDQSYLYPDDASAASALDAAHSAYVPPQSRQLATEVVSVSAQLADMKERLTRIEARQVRRGGVLTHTVSALYSIVVGDGLMACAYCVEYLSSCLPVYCVL